MMHSLVNVPHQGSRCRLETRIRENSVYVVLHDPNIERKEFADVNVCDIFIGDHMFEKKDDLREMIGGAMKYLIIAARDVGYRQAQADIRSAIGFVK